jgi:hypothetical protein
MLEFQIFKIMYIILEGLNDEKFNKSLDIYLSEINPYIWEGTSGDPSYFNSFKKYLAKYGINKYGYQAVYNFIKDEDYYTEIFSIFSTLSEEEYIENAEIIINDNLKEFSLLKKI